MADFEILIKTEADLRAAQATNDALDKMGKTAAASGAEIAKAVAAAAGAAAVAAITRAVQEFAEYEQAVFGLDAALARNGQLTDAYREKLQGLANDLETTTNIADDQWIGVLQRLVQFGSKPESIGMDVDAVKNLAGIVGDVSTAANLYTRALQGNFEMFGRYGIRVEEAATQTERLARLQEQLAQRGGGQLEARTKSLSGEFKGLSNSIGNVFQGLGNLISRSDIIQALIEPMITGLNRTAGMFPEVAEKARGLQNAIGDVGNAFNDLDGDPFNKAREGASKAKKEIDALLGSLRAVQRLQDEMGDARLAEELARIDLEQAQSQSTPESDAAFDLRRRRARGLSQFNRANREFFAAGDQLRALQAARARATDPEEQADLDRQIFEAQGRRETAGAGVRTANIGLQASVLGGQKVIAERAAERVNKQQQQEEAAARQILQELGAGNRMNLQLLQSLLQESRTFRAEIERLNNREGNRR